MLTKKNILDKNETASEFNNFFVKSHKKLAEKIQLSKYSSESYIDYINTKLPEQSVSINELKEVFFSVKPNKSTEIDDINARVIRRCFGQLAAPLKHISDLSLSQGVFPDKVEIAKVTPTYKNDGSFILPCLSKFLNV